MKEIQYVSVESAQIFEVTRIKITNPDSGEFLLIFQNPTDLSSSKSEVIKADSTAS